MQRLLNARAEWTGIVVSNDDEAIAICQHHLINLVLLGNGIHEQSEILLREKLKALKPEVKIIQHYGGGSGLLYGEIMQAMV